MAEFSGAASEVNARIVYWGPQGAGKTTNLKVIHAKLRPDHRGELREVPTRLDPSVCYHMLPIELGDVGGVRTRIQVMTVPSGAEHAPTRKQLLDQVDGVVFVVDTTPERAEANLACFEELRAALLDYGRPVEEVPLVFQYNKRDASDPFVLEDLHRKLHIPGVAAFEAVAHEGTAVLQTLTTISKRVIRHLREKPRTDPEAPAESAPAPTPPQGVTQILDGMAPMPAAGGDAPLAPPPEVPDGALFDDDPAPAPAPRPAPAPVPEVAPSPPPPDAALEAESLAAEAEHVFEPGFRSDVQETAYAEPQEDAPWEMVEIAAVGQAARQDARTVRVPVILRDERGRELRAALTVRIEPEEPGQG